MPFLSSLLSTSLMLLPVGVTLGVYAGVQTQQIVNAIHGKIPPGAITQIDPFGNPVPAPVITTTMYCQDEAAIEVYPFRYVCKYTSVLPLLCPSRTSNRVKRPRWVLCSLSRRTDSNVQRLSVLFTAEHR
jgi:hypothetical protein